MKRYLKEWAANVGVELIKARVGDANKQGIHLLEPNELELERALEQAERDMFQAIYIHTEKNWLK